MSRPMDAGSQFNNHRHPALFQRVSPNFTSAFETAGPSSPDIYAAFAGFVQHRAGPVSQPVEIWEYLDSLGFHPHEIQQMRVGSYPSAEDVRDFLLGTGFSDAAVLESGLVTDSRGALRRDWQGGLIVPLEDENGQICDVLALILPLVSGQPFRREFARGPVRSEIAAYGLKTAFATSAGRQNLVLVEDILEAFYLQCRGFTNVAAVGSDGREFSSKRWEALARLGVETVTLAFGNDATRQRDVREALDHALRAPSAPEVFVLERAQLLEKETLADVARRHGLEACQKAASVKSLAFHGKNFGWSFAPEQAPVNGHAASLGFPRKSHRRDLWADSERIGHPYERAAVQQTIAEVDEALFHRHYALARSVLESRLTHPWRLPVRAEIQSTDVNAILDRLCEEKNHAAVPEHLSRYDGNELQVGTVTVLANESIRGRLADLCSRLVTALETRDDQTWLVVCREFSEEVIVLGLIAHMTRRMTSAQGLTFEEIQARLSGRDPKDGYGDKPWLVDEALDRLRRWRNRLKFLANAADSAETAASIERIAETQTLGGVFFDHLPAGSADWRMPNNSMETLRDLAARLSCAVVAVTDQAAAASQRMPLENSEVKWNDHQISPVVREFRERIADWIEQAEREEIRVA